MFTVILPAAGQGTRLGLPYPKELHRILPDASLIDFSLHHVHVSASLVERVVTVVVPGKESVADHVASAVGDAARTAHTYFNDAYSEWPGSIKSAEDLFGEYNVVLLPDSYLETRDHRPLLDTYRESFDSGADIVFGYVEEHDPDRLTNLGALQVDGSDVIGFCDKPDRLEAVAYNAFWGSFGFRKEAGADLLDLMMESVANATVDLESLRRRVSAFTLDSYTDLGTWDSVSDFIVTRGARAA